MNLDALSQAQKRSVMRLTPIAFALSILLPACGPSKAELARAAEREEARLLQIFRASPQENLKPTRWDTGDTTVSNENRLELFGKRVTGLRGGYFGVGSFQNLTIAAWAESEWVWQMDFTRIVVAANKCNVAFIKESNTPADFRSFWQKNAATRALAVIDRELKSDPDLAFIKRSYRKAAPYVRIRLNLDLKLAKMLKYATWMTNQKLYDHIRGLAKAGKIRILKGDLSGKTTAQGIARAAKEMGVTMRILYFSNAEEYIGVCWKPCSAQFQANMAAMPIDEHSMVLRTVSSVKKRVLVWAPLSEISGNKRGFHFNVQLARDFQKWMNYKGKKFGIVDYLKGAEVDKKVGFSVAKALPPASQK